jgi:hypothetical protein
MPETMENGFFLSRMAKTTITAKLGPNLMSPSIHRNALIPDGPDKERLLSSPSLVPYGFPFKVKGGLQDTRPFQGC